jgi:hypothetical protein
VCVLGPAVTTVREAIDELQSTVRAAADSELRWSDARAALLELERERERLEHTIGALVSDCAARRAHERDSARSMADWLTAQTGARRAATGSRANLATKLRSMPETDAALADGAITHTHAQVLARALNPRTVEAFARDEGMLVAAARKLTADQLVQVVELWLRHADPDGSAPDPEGPDDTFFLSQTIDGRLKGNFDLGGEAAITAKAVIDEMTQELRRREQSARKADPTDPRIDDPVSRRRARALVELLHRAAASPKNPARRLPLLNLHTTVETIAGTGDPFGWKLEVEQAWRAAISADLLDIWSCDCFAGRIVLDAEGLPLDVGRAERLATPAQRRAVIARDGSTCPVPGCTAPAEWTRMHHIRHWTAHGLTKEDNLVGSCDWHHTRIHEGKLCVRMVDGRPEFFLPDGTILGNVRAP